MLWRGSPAIPDPYAPRSYRTGQERLSTLETLLGRLRKLGATDDELGAFAVTWDDLDADWTDQHRSAMARSSDAELRDAILAARDEYRTSRPLEDEPAPDLIDAAREVVNGGVRGVFAWVGHDPARARAILDLELGPDGAARKSLVARLQSVAG